MSTKLRAAGVLMLIAPMALVSGGVAVAVGPEDLPADVRECVAPILEGGPSADVVQGWIDTCRTLNGQRVYDDAIGPGRP